MLIRTLRLVPRAVGQAAARASSSSLSALPSSAAGASLRFFSAASGAELDERLTAPREQVEYDVVVVGGGPAGLSAAIKLKQLAEKTGKELSVCIVEKGHEIGAHILSGNVFEPRALDELIPDWKEKGAPLNTPATEDHFYFLTEKNCLPMPTVPMLHNEGNYVISLSQLCRWLGKQAEEAGVDIFPASPAAEVLYSNSSGSGSGKGFVRGIATADVGIGKDGKLKDSFTRGMEILGKQTLFAEGARGSCSEELMSVFNLREGKDPQTYGLGVKEVWRIPQDKCKPGYIQHTLGWPLSNDVYGGSFLYHMGPDLVLLGFVVGLDYANPYISPYQEFQRWKHHPVVAKHLEGGECIQYGARVINEGGLQSVPKLTFPGGALIGCSAGFLNVPKIKGTHTAMKSGILAAESVFEALTGEKDPVQAGLAKRSAAAAAAAPVEQKKEEGEGESGDERSGLEVHSYEEQMKKSWVWQELNEVRNFHPSFKPFGRLGGMLYSGLSAYVLKGREPWTFHHTKKDSEMTRPAAEFTPIQYPKPDGKLSFDLLSNLARSGTNHEGDQPAHLRIKQGMEAVPSDVSYAVYAGPEGRFCPAKVYEYPESEDASQPKGKLVINAQNCVHCKCCSIKTPQEYIKWTVPEAGGGGPA